MFGDCTMTSSPHQLVYDLYTLLALTEAKGYAMMQFSWMLLRLYGKGQSSSNLFCYPLAYRINRINTLSIFKEFNVPITIPIIIKLDKQYLGNLIDKY